MIEAVAISSRVRKELGPKKFSNECSAASRSFLPREILQRRNSHVAGQSAQLLMYLMMCYAAQASHLNELHGKQPPHMAHLHRQIACHCADAAMKSRRGLREVDNIGLDKVQGYGISLGNCLRGGAADAAARCAVQQQNKTDWTAQMCSNAEEQDGEHPVTPQQQRRVCFDEDNLLANQRDVEAGLYATEVIDDSHTPYPRSPATSSEPALSNLDLESTSRCCGSESVRISESTEDNLESGFDARLRGSVVVPPEPRDSNAEDDSSVLQ